MNKKTITITENANKLRAEIIGNAISVEDILTETLGLLYMYPMSSQDLINDVISDLTFDKKIKLFSKFVKIYPEAFSKYPTLIRDLHEVREKRNLMAHSSLSIPFFLDELNLDKDDFDYLTNEMIQWKTVCEFIMGTKSNKLSIDDLDKFKALCVRLMMHIHSGFLTIIKSKTKKV